MRVGKKPQLHLAYCLNVHPGETWAENIETIRTSVPDVRKRVGRREPFGLGLRLSNEASVTLTNPVELARFSDFLTHHDLYVFTINGFPYGRFHGESVKENVYAPDWRTDERRDYTIRLADILAHLLPSGVSGSISTVPGSYKAWIKSDSDIDAMVRNLVSVVAHLAAIREVSGCEIHIGLEPEPDCFIETSQEAVSFLAEELPQRGAALLAAARDCTEAGARVLLQRHLGICFDACHQLVQFEDPVDSIEMLHSHGIRISKVQVSAALKTRCDESARALLSPFCDPVYLHQVRATADGSVFARGDLADALAAPLPATDEEWRVHCHVPLYFEGSGSLRSTADALSPEFFRACAAAGTRHFEIETYTFEVLPEPLRAAGLTASIANEYLWLLPRLEEGC